MPNDHKVALICAYKCLITFVAADAALLKIEPI
jgi:hypothetical protein